MSDINANINVNSNKAQSDTQKLVNALNKATTSLDKLNVSMAKSTGYTRKANTETKKYSKSLTDLERHARSSSKSLLALESASKAVSNVWRIILGYQIGKNLLQSAAGIEATAQKVDLLNKKLTVLTGEANAFEIVKMTAFDAGIAMDTLGAVVGRFAIASRGVFSTEEMTKWAETLVLSGRAAGTTAKEIDSTLLQLSQAFSSGNLMGEELRAIRENAPLYLSALREVADESGFVGKTIKDMGADSEIGMNMMVAAFGKLETKISRFEGLTDTLNAATVRMQDQWQLLVNEMYAGQNIFTDLANTAAGFLIYMRDDADMIEAFSKKFPQLSKAVDMTITAFKLLAIPVKAVGDAIYIVFKAITELHNRMGLLTELILAGAVAWKVYSSSATVAMLATAKLTSNIALLNTAMAGLLGWEIGTYLRDEFVIVEKAGIYMVDSLVRSMNFLTYSWDVAMATFQSPVDATMSYIRGEFADFIRDLIFLLDLLPDSIVPDSWESGLKQLRTGLVPVKGEMSAFEIATEKAKVELEKANKILDDSTNTALEFADAKHKDVEVTNKQKILYNTTATEVDKYKNKLDEMKTSLDEVYAANSEYEKSMNDLWDMYENGVINLIEFQKLEALITSERDSAIAKANELTKSEKALNKATEEAIKLREKGGKSFQNYQKAVVALTNDLDSLRDVVEFEPDTIDQYKKFNDQLSNLGHAYAVGAISVDQYKTSVSELEELNGKIIAQMKENHLRDMAHGYDAVAKAMYDTTQSTKELEGLFKRQKISAEVYGKELRRLQANLLEVAAANGQLSEGDQMWEGTKEGARQFAEESKSTFEMMKDATTGAFGGMTDEITKFVTTGKADFTGLVDSIVEDLTRIAVQKSITEPLAEMIFGGGTQQSGETSSGISGMMGSFTKLLGAGGAGDSGTGMLDGPVSGIGSMFGGDECNPCTMASEGAMDMFDEVGVSFGETIEGFDNGFGSLIDTVGSDFGDILGDMGSGLSNVLSNLNFGGGSDGGMGDLFGSALSLFGFKNGSAFSQGNVTPFASGGIVNSPTLFPMADGAGLMGEDGAEAIMPLKRGKDGKLGVASSGGQNITININVAGVSGNEEAMRRSAGQVAQAAGNATSRAMRRNG